MYHVLSEIVILVSEKGTDAMWPENPGVDVVVSGRCRSGPLGGGNLLEGRRKAVPPGSA